MKASRCLLFILLLMVVTHVSGFAQSGPYERSFPQSKAAVEKAVKGLQTSMSGRLPTLEGFAVAGSRPWERFQRPYYQCSVQVSPSSSGGSIVRVSTKITAWYNDSAAGRSGYEALQSNGRLEADLLDQLGDALGATSSAQPSRAPITKPASAPPDLSAPVPQIPADAFPKSGVAMTKRTPTSAPATAPDQRLEHLRQEAKNLQQILQNQSHPDNLVAVKKSGTPLLAGPRLDAKILFYASAQDEFEILDVNPDWVHVRISGLSRGWIRRSSLEMPDAVPQADAVVGATTASGEPFRITSEQTAPFPGNWPPLRGKTVRIISVQKTDRIISNPANKLAYAKTLLDKTYPELSHDVAKLSGVLLIFDSEDGGMLAATVATLQRWKDGTLSDEALWRQCFFDPPETFGIWNTASANR